MHYKNIASCFNNPILNILSNIREALYSTIVSENTLIHDLSNIDQFLGLYFSLSKTQKNKIRLKEIELSLAYKELTKLYTPNLPLAMLHTVFYIEGLVNTNILKTLSYKKTKTMQLQEEQLFRLGKEHLIDFLKKILETKIEHSFYSAVPLSIFDLEITQLTHRIKNSNHKNIIIKPNTLSPEICAYIMVNCYIKYFLPTNPQNNDLFSGYYM